MPRRSTRKALL